MLKLVCTSLIIICGLQTAYAQHIKRKGSLGIGFYQKNPDSLVKQLGYRQGCIVQFVLPNTTAAEIGLQANDIITGINNREIKLPNEVLIPVKTLRENEPVTMNIIREKKPLLLKGRVASRPRETSATADVVYGEFAYKNGYIRTIYKTLKGKKPVGTIYFLQGLPCYSMDNFQPLDKTKQALDAMVDRGFAVYRMEKADMGDNVNMPPCETMGYHEELEMYMAGYKNLLQLDNVDTSRIFLFGHSMGGITAPLLAEKFQPRGVVVYGTGFKPWMDYLLDAFLIQAQYYGEDLADLRDTLEKIKPHIYRYFYTNATADEICQTPEGELAMEAVLGYNKTTKLAASGRSPLCFKELNQQNLARAWGNTNSPVLAIYGECDIAANNAADHQSLIDYINKKRPGNGTFWLAPGTTHTFEEIGTMQDYINWQRRLPEYYQYAATRFNPKVFDYVCNWMKKVVAD